MAAAEVAGPRLRPCWSRLTLLGPAFVAAVAYVDPGNVATNVTSGAQYGYLLVWVVVAANVMAVLVQYLSAKLGVVTGASLPEVIGERVRRRGVRLAYWAQAELVAMATDLAEVIGGAVALNLLAGLPLLAGGAITGAVSLALLGVQNRSGQQPFERVIIGLLAIVTIGFLASLVVSPPDSSAAANGLIPRFEGSNSILLAAGILGATIMPHAVYLHSALARDRHGRPAAAPPNSLLSATRIDVASAMVLAGAVNLGLLLLAAANLRGLAGTDTLEGAHAAVADVLGHGTALLFALGLLASGLASTSVGCYAGAVIMEGLLRRRVPIGVRRLITLVPALTLLASGVDPTDALVTSQVVLSFGIPFVLIPLVVLTAKRDVMGDAVNAGLTTVAASAVAAAVVALNLALLWLSLSPFH